MAAVVYSLTFDLKAVQVLEFAGDDNAFQPVLASLKAFHAHGAPTGWIPPLLRVSRESAQREPTRFRPAVEIPTGLVIEQQFLLRHHLLVIPGMTLMPLRNDGLVLGLVSGVDVEIREETSAVPPAFLQPMVVDFAGDMPLDQVFALRRPRRWGPAGLFIAAADDREPEFLRVIRSTPTSGLRVDVAWTSLDGARAVPFV